MVPSSPPPSPPRCAARHPCPGQSGRPAKTRGRRHWRRRPPADRMVRCSCCHLPRRRLALLFPPLDDHSSDEHALQHESLRTGQRRLRPFCIDSRSCARHDAESWARHAPSVANSAPVITDWLDGRASCCLDAGWPSLLPGLRCRQPQEHGRPARDGCLLAAARGRTPCCCLVTCSPGGHQDASGTYRYSSLTSARNALWLLGQQPFRGRCAGRTLMLSRTDA